MARASPANQRRARTRPEPRGGAPAPRDNRFRWLDWLAFGWLVAVVVARLMMLEALRSTLAVSPGAPPAPAGPGPAAGLVLDLLGCVPTLLVLTRRWLDRTFAVRFSLSFIPLGLLGVWAVLSTFWATDKFAALVSSSHLLAAFVALWAAAQLVRTWLHLRLLAGLCYGMLLVLVAHGAYFLVFERPPLVEEWKQHGDEILRQRGIQPGTFEAGQFANKVLHGELMGFSASPNTYAALLVLTMVVTLGVVIDRASRWRAGHPAGRGPAVVIVAAGVAAVAIVAPALWMIYLAQSRQAYVTYVLGIVGLTVITTAGPWLARLWAALYAAGVAGFALVAAFLVQHGLRRGTLFHDSLNFRWRYWVGAARLFKLHPLLGVGWENFGPHYLATRLPTATEEIRDPHNFIVRFFVELGMAGGLLLLAWLLRLWWELGRPVVAVTSVPSVPPSGPPGTTGSAGVVGVVAVAIAGVALNAAASIDFSAGGGFVVIELFRRLIFLVALLLGAGVVCLRARSPVVLDDEPAPRVLSALILGLGLFLVHNLIDFSLFEVGPMFLFALLTGAAVALRTPAGEPRPRGRPAAAAALCAGGVLWLVAAVALVAPVASAEGTAQDADELVRQGRVAEGAAALEGAFRKMPLNADYAFRAAQVWRGMSLANRSRGMAGAADREADRARQWFDAAIAADPASAGYRVARADLELEQADLPNLPAASLEAARASYEQALRLDPNNVRNRIRYASVLERLGRPREAAAAYEKALWYNDQLTREEKKRLPEAEVADLRQRIARLTAGG